MSRMKCAPLVYFIIAPKSNLVKIGYTETSPIKRLSELQTGSPEKLELQGIIWGTKKLEKAIHITLENQGNLFHGEWFKLNKNTERFLSKTISYSHNLEFDNSIDDKILFNPRILDCADKEFEFINNNELLKINRISYKICSMCHSIIKINDDSFFYNFYDCKKIHLLICKECCTVEGIPLDFLSRETVRYRRVKNEYRCANPDRLPV